MHDVAHYGANVLENRWTRDPRWQEFLRRMSQGNQKMRHTAQAYLLAPTLRPKARFMNVNPFLSCGTPALTTGALRVSGGVIVHDRGQLLSERRTAI